MSKNNYLNVLLISGSGIISGLINYMYYPIMLKFLTIEEFGVFGSLVGMFNILGVLTIGLILFLNKEISKNIENKGRIKFIFYSSTKLLFILSLFLYFLYFIFSGFIAEFLNIYNTGLVYIVGFSIILGFLSVSENAVLRGLKKFEFLSIVSIVLPFLKLILGFILVFLGFKIYGAVIGFIMGGFLSLFISFIYLYKYFKNIKQIGDTKELIKDFNTNKKSIINFFLGSLFFAILMNIDVILAKNLFDETTAGIYAGLSVLGKFLIFLLLSIETVYYGQIMEHKKGALPKHMVKNPIFLLSIVSILALVFNYFFGFYILDLLKPELAENIKVYLLSLIFYSFLAFISFFSKVLIGWGKYYVNYLMGFLTLALIGTIYSFGSDLVNFVYCFIFIGILGTISLGILFIIEYKNHKLTN